MKSLFAACPGDWEQAWQPIMYNSALGGELGLSQVVPAGMLAQLAPDGSSVSSQFQETLHGDVVQGYRFQHSWVCSRCLTSHKVKVFADCSCIEDTARPPCLPDRSSGPHPLLFLGGVYISCGKWLQGWHWPLHLDELKLYETKEKETQVMSLLRHCR